MSNAIAEFMSSHMVANKGNLSLALISKMLGDITIMQKVKQSDPSTLLNMLFQKWLVEVNLSFVAGGATQDHFSALRINDLLQYLTNNDNLPASAADEALMDAQLKAVEADLHNAPRNVRRAAILARCNRLKERQLRNQDLKRNWRMANTEITECEQLGITLANHITSKWPKWIVDQLYDILHPLPTTVAGANGFDRHAALPAHNPNPLFDRGFQLCDKPLENFILHINLINEVGKLVPQVNALEAQQHNNTINSDAYHCKKDQAYSQWHAATHNTDVQALANTHLRYTSGDKFARTIAGYASVGIQRLGDYWQQLTCSN